MCKDCGCSISGHENEVLKEKKTIDVITNILDKNNHEASHNKKHLDDLGILAINLMSSPGSGKTTLLEATIKNTNYKIGVVEGDLETNQDANRIIKAGAKAHQISTGQSCHLDAFMVHTGLHHLDLNDLDLVFVENVGNLVCPASYELGTHLDVVLLSVPEGDDKISKYPVMFRKADLVIITKISLIQHFNFSLEKAKADLALLNPKANLIALDSISGEGLDKWIKFIEFNKNFKKEFK